MIHENRYIWLDLFRGLSALAVCAGHLRAAIFSDFSQQADGGVIANIFYFATGLGHQSVVVFFVLSGFFVGGSVLNRSHDFKFSEYALARLSRLWMVLIPALVATFLIDRLTYAYRPELFLGEHYSVINSGPTAGGEYSVSALTFLANMAFLQTIYTPVFGSNGPLWSLANEFWYYVIFPLGLIILGHLRSSLLARTLALLICVLIISFITYDLMEGFVIWLFGVIVFNIYNRSRYNAPFTLVTLSAALFGSSLFLSKTGYSTIFAPLSSDIVCAILFSLFLISINNKTCPERWQRSIAAASKRLSDFSYSLYLFHFPVVLLIYAAFYSEQQLEFNAVNVLKFGLWMVLLAAIGYGFWWLFEKRTENIRKFMHSKVLRPSTRPI